MSDPSEESKEPKSREKSVMDSLFDDDSDENYETDAGPASLDAFFAAAAAAAEDEDEVQGSGAKLFDDDDALDSDLDKAFGELGLKQEPAKAADKKKEPEKSKEEDKPNEAEKSKESDKPKESEKEKEEEPKREREPEREREREREPEREREREPEKTSKKAAVPDWCSKITFAELHNLELELADLNDEVKRTTKKLENLATQITSVSEVKNALLSLSGAKLTRACCRVFEELGWSVSISETRSEEIWLKEDDKVKAIVRISSSAGQPNLSEVARLAESVIQHWSQYDHEPKGILLASTYREQPPEERTDPDFSKQMSDFAERKDLSLLSSMQLLSIYRDVAIKNADKSKLSKKLLSNVGVLPEHKLDTSNN